MKKSELYKLFSEQTLYNIRNDLAYLEYQAIGSAKLQYLSEIKEIDIQLDERKNYLKQKTQ